MRASMLGISCREVCPDLVSIAFPSSRACVSWWLTILPIWICGTLTDFRCAAKGDDRYSQCYGEAKGDDQVDLRNPTRLDSTQPVGILFYLVEGPLSSYPGGDDVFMIRTCFSFTLSMMNHLRIPLLVRSGFERAAVPRSPTFLA
jgi:hypothetical protein